MQRNRHSFRLMEISLNANIKIYQYLRLHIKIICRRFRIIRLFEIHAPEIRVFPTGGSIPPLAENLLILPPPNQIFVPTPPNPPQTKGSFPPPLNNNFLNGQNYSSSDFHHPIKKSPHCTALHCTAISLLLKTI